MNLPASRSLIAATFATLLAVFTSTAGLAQPASAVPEQPPIAAEQIPKYITDAVNSPARPAADKELDAGRNPTQVLAFYGIKPGMKVADLFAGGGYTSELLALVVGPDGKVYSQNMPFPPRFAKVKAAYDARMKTPAMKDVTAVVQPFSSQDLLPVPPGSLDAVMIYENYHDLVGQNLAPENVDAEVFKALKPGGEYCVVDHSAAKSSGARDAATLHRIDEDYEVAQIEKAGFKLAAASSALRHPEDDRTWIVFKHRGQTDRFMLKFVKPE